MTKTRVDAALERAESWLHSSQENGWIRVQELKDLVASQQAEIAALRADLLRVTEENARWQAACQRWWMSAIVSRG